MKVFLCTLLSTVLFVSTTSASYANNDVRLQDAIKRKTAAIAREVQAARNPTQKRAILERHLTSIAERTEDIAADASAVVNGREITVDAQSQATIQQLNVLATDYLAALDSVADEDLNEFANSLNNEFQKAVLYVLSILFAVGLGVYLMSWIIGGIPVVY